MSASSVRGYRFSASLRRHADSRSVAISRNVRRVTNKKAPGIDFYIIRQSGVQTACLLQKTRPSTSGLFVPIFSPSGVFFCAPGPSHENLHIRACDCNYMADDSPASDHRTRNTRRCPARGRDYADNETR